MIPEFTSLDWFYVRSLGRIAAVVQLDQETSDFAHLIGQSVRVDGALYFCTAVERFAHSPPWRPGERISLVLGSLD